MFCGQEDQITTLKRRNSENNNQNDEEYLELDVQVDEEDVEGDENGHTTQREKKKSQSKPKVQIIDSASCRAKDACLDVFQVLFFSKISFSNQFHFKFVAWSSN